MNELLQILLLSTAATSGVKKLNAQKTPTSNYPKRSTSSNVLTRRTCNNDSNKRQEMISTNKIISALNAADEASNMQPTATGPFTLKPLNYDYNALEPYIDEATLRLHHGAHHQTYVNNLNKALSRYPDNYDQTLNEILLFPDRLPGDIQTQVTNNAGGHYNHTLMWQVIGPQTGQKPTGALGDAINAQFGSYENFKRAFSAAAESVFGSGYAYLVLNPYGRLLIITTSNQTTPIPLRTIPLLPLDVWEHAYYLKHQNKRANYINDYFNVINWNEVGKRYDAATAVLNDPTIE